ncbi:hypothetical protein HHI36_021012 [Cryptolaemus montrouzieri]|uniref:GH18 domain-containing protein n=1 Tax=Cryptolaemus montrouzieri TaxID=559131 RepID=A0ABD2MVE5_9CUCU
MDNSTIALILACSILPIYSITIQVPKHPRIVCYYTFPNQQYNLQPENIDGNLCTHILVAFATILNNSVSISQENVEIVTKVVQLKLLNPDLKVLLSFGGGGDEYGFPEMVRNESNRATFIKSVEFAIEKLNLDGIDLDWEFPSNSSNKGHLVELLEDLRQSINNSAKKYILSVAVAAPITLVDVSYDVPAINRLVDFINVMSYDYNFFSLLTPWTGMNAPLYARSIDIFYFKTQNINYTSIFWIKKGMDKNKVNIGLPVYAHTYTLRSPNKTFLGAPAIGNGKIGGGGSASYGEVCKFMKDEKLTPIFDDETKSPYVTNGSEWISFENDESMKFKAQYIYNNDFGGVMVFSLSSDDYNGDCYGETFPNTKIISRIFRR